MTLTPEGLRQRLRNHARKHGMAAQNMMLLYIQQGFLARLAVSEYHEDFVLKGGLSLFVRYQQAARPTRDIDLAARHLGNTEDAVRQAMLDITRIHLDDLLTFSAEEIHTSQITEASEYPGVRVEMVGRMEDSFEKLQLDISFGNAITPGPEVLTFPQIVVPEGVPLKVYPLTTVVAEKFAAMVEIGETTTRMKDFYDLHAIFTQEVFELQALREALERSFQQRGTPTHEVSTVLGDDFQNSEVLARVWRQYLNKSQLQAPKQFGEVMALIQQALRRVFDGTPGSLLWYPNARMWQPPSTP